ncbi:hypothetical protein HBH82_090470 [Parastagonospora nodorum]|nr:hypothetical protein HBH82_090470 [Parastagonospora nodorum]KAH4710672.1 hypothetical protein HBH67_032810 [Parastagonospora nodorum]KAH4715225.1 hypothetical protein HBH78_035420 [Parastagonospora nodorum]KAH4784594.1 hypothetical protein HBH62_092400 [Parastagonospora nodorum]KAH4838484.1 hypothetical protein HBH63_010510 [Parastagonospora nodorum]
MAFTIDIPFPHPGVNSNTPDCSTPNDTIDIDSNSTNPQSLQPVVVRTDSVHNGTARSNIHATHTIYRFEFLSPVRDVEALRSNMNQVTRALRFPSSYPETQWVLAMMLDCYRLAVVAILETHGIVLQGAPQPVYGPRPRPLPRAAIFQNVDARIQHLLETGGFRDARRVSVSSPERKTEPIRYDDAYDNMLGTRSADDGSAAAYAYRDGAEATNELRFRQGFHNGLPFGRAHAYITTLDRNLVEARQARHLAGLSTRSMDIEIATRAVRDTDSWGWVGMYMFESRLMERGLQLTLCVAELEGMSVDLR